MDCFSINSFFTAEPEETVGADILVDEGDSVMSGNESAQMFDYDQPTSSSGNYCVIV